MIAREWLQQARERLSGFPSPEVDARLLLEHLMGRPLDLNAVVDLPAANSLLERRIGFEPVQYITGEAPFRYQVLKVGPGVLIPRPETESLVDLAKAEIGDRSTTVIDLGAGSGAIAIAIATETAAQVVAVEKDPAAFVWLERNVQQLAPSVQCVLADVSEVNFTDVDVVVANPPYLSDEPLAREVVEYEPALALFGGEQGTAIPKLFIKVANSMLRSGGWFVLEHAAEHQDEIVELVSEYFVDVKRHHDLLGRPRFVSGRRP